MTKIKRKLAGKAAKTTAKHTVHGTAAKLKRSPLRAGTLIALGVAVGFVLGRIAGGSSEDSSS